MANKPDIINFLSKHSFQFHSLNIVSIFSRSPAGQFHIVLARILLCLCFSIIVVVAGVLGYEREGRKVSIALGSGPSNVPIAFSSKNEMKQKKNEEGLQN